MPHMNPVSDLLSRIFRGALKLVLVLAAMVFVLSFLLAALVAVLVMGVGLLGIAAMQATALRNNQSALERTQATIQTYSILDAMRANRDAALAVRIAEAEADAAGKLVEVLPGWAPVGSFADQIYAIRPYSAHVPRAVSALVDYLRRSLSPGFG